MSLRPSSAYFPECQPLLAAALPWFAIRTRSNFEKTTSAVLASKGYEQYLPLYRVQRRWSDRVVETHIPLFPGYVFCRFDPKVRVPILSTVGVVAIITFGAEPARVPDAEIEAIQTVLNSGLVAGPWPFVREGQRVRIKYGPMEGLEGILMKKKNDLRMVISVTMLQRSVAVEIDNASIATI